jgi:23S rRNA pseudouridine1911/1915/1917 synthase
MKTWKWVVPEQIHSINRADRMITEALQQFHPLSRSRVQKLIDEGHVLLNGETFLSKELLEPGDEIEIEFPEPEALDLTPDPQVPIDILYEDEWIAVINKAPGITVHPSETQKTGTLVHGLLAHLKNLSGIGGVLRPGIVHRIDKDTSGALVISKKDEAHIPLSQMFARHELERTYWALCYGSPPSSNQQTIHAPGLQIQLTSSFGFSVKSKIGRHPTDRKKMSHLCSQGREAHSWLKCTETYPDPASFWEATLETGRTHQVRVHLTALGYPLLGDPVYGSPRKLRKTVQDAVDQLPGQALHARILGFEHPITKKLLRFEAPPPPTFQNVLNTLRNSL